MKLDPKQAKKVLDSLWSRLEDAFAKGEKLTWNSFLSHIGSFFNPSTDNPYKGMFNGLMLSFTSMAFEGEMRFIGFGQARKMGGSVKKGEKSTPIFRPIIVQDKDDKSKTVCLGFRHCEVFNIRQTDLIEKGIIPEKVESTNADLVPISAVEDFTKWIDYEKTVSRGCPYYSPKADNIGMPEFDSFKNAWKHSESLLHELIHWTGHKSRLDRLGDFWQNARDHTDRSKEELVAEIGAALMLNHLGLKPTEEMETNQAAYLQSWLEPLKNDLTMLLTATTEAVAACNFLIKMHKEGKAESEKRKARMIA